MGHRFWVPVQYNCAHPGVRKKKAPEEKSSTWNMSSRAPTMRGSSRRMMMALEKNIQGRAG